MSSPTEPPGSPAGNAQSAVGLGADDWKALFDELQSHPGIVALRKWREWAIVASAMRRNESDLLSFVDLPSREPELAIELIQNVRPPEISERYFGEMYRLLHNYLASMKTLVDHSRALVSGYGASAFQPEYEARVVSIGQMPVARFVQDLRNVLLHEQLPPIETRVSWTSATSEQEFGLFFIGAELLSCGRFGAGARSYIDEQPPSFPVVAPIREYGQLVHELADWLAAQFQTVHGDDMAAYQRKAREWHNRTGPPGTPA